MSDYKLTPTDHAILDRARNLETGGIATFTAHYFAPIDGDPRFDLVGEPLDTWDLQPNQYVPWVPLDWQMVLAHDSRMDHTIIAGFGAGKTEGAAAVALYWGVMMSNFKFMNVAPVGWQSKQMYDAAVDNLINWHNRDTQPTHISHLIKSIVKRPYPKITLFNGSTLEFMSASEQGSKLRSWSGDAISVDEASKMSTVGVDLDELIINLGSRLRGVVAGGRERLGKLLVMSNADYEPALWDRFDRAELEPEHYVSLVATTYDNPYLSEDQVAAMKRRITDPDRQRQLLMSERPMPKGDEFTRNVIEACQNKAIDEMMAHAMANQLPGYEKVRVQRTGIVTWVTPPTTHDKYVLVGDPGQNMPPSRNSASIMVWRVTGFPDVPAELAAFWWGPQNKADIGSYWPFIHKMEEWSRLYHPVYSAFDATGTQKGFDELVFAQRGILIEGADMSGHKKRQMILALKLIMSKGLIQGPKTLKPMWHQLAAWRHPDTKLRQDVASSMFLLGHLLNRLFMVEAEETDDDWGTEIYSWKRTDRAGRTESNQRLGRSVRQGRNARTRAGR